jgi:hypothetical protein
MRVDCHALLAVIYYAPEKLRYTACGIMHPKNWTGD